MNELSISCKLNTLHVKYDSSLFNFATNTIGEIVMRFHKSLPDYKPTPTIRLSSLAKMLGVKEILIKDESQRFDLNAFKVLGASYAMAKALAKLLNLENTRLNFNDILKHQNKFKNITFITATDGNHGRAVAWSSRKFGCNAVVYMPKGSSQARLDAIRSYGANASITDKNYDDTVLYANEMAKENNWLLLQDTSWKSYEEIPTHIMQGYFSLVTEFLHSKPNSWPTHVFLQAGVGSLPAAIVAYMCSFTDKPTPTFIIVEPQGAPCLYNSVKLNNGKPYKVHGSLETIMAGLACGEPSRIALKVLNVKANAFIKCSDKIAKRGMRILGNPLRGDNAIISGESGGVTLGLVYELLSNKKFSNIKDDLNLNQDSKVLLFSTEGDTDFDAYRQIVWS